MRLCKSQPLVTLLVPFRKGNDPQRIRTWKWLKEFYSNPKYGFEIVEGHDDGMPFSKANAVNKAALKAHGKVFVVIDADCYINPMVIQSCAERIVAAEDAGRKLWFIPYLRLYRLTKLKTSHVLRRNPLHAFDMPYPAPQDWTEKENADRYGHQYGAMILIMSAKAFWTTGGMDPRFRGWGNEDMSFMFSMDTLYGLHETVDYGIFHLWHERPGADTSSRHWDGQTKVNMNTRLGQRYTAARGDKTFMKALISERYRPTKLELVQRWIKQRLNCIRIFRWHHLKRY